MKWEGAKQVAKLREMSQAHKDKKVPSLPPCPKTPSPSLQSPTARAGYTGSRERT